METYEDFIIKKPKIDTRDYQFFELENGLKVLTIHDPEADKAGACLDVNAGQLLDPPTR